MCVASPYKLGTLPTSHPKRLPLDAKVQVTQSAGQEGSRVFTYVDQDEACQDFEAGQASATQTGINPSPLYRKILRERSWNDKVHGAAAATRLKLHLFRSLYGHAKSLPLLVALRS